jgi:predicted O-linked N-acetylglucosamine transferase (SPINDLY family)
VNAEDPLSRARARLRAGELREAEGQLRRLLAQRPEHAEALALLAAIAFRRGDPRAARELLERAVASAPDDAALHAQLAEARRTSGDATGAEAAARHAVELAPGRAAGWNNLGLALQSQGRLAEAEASFRRAAADRRYAKARYNLGNVLRLQGRHDEAASALRAALRLEPAYAQAHNALGVVLGERGELAAAIAHLERAITHAPGDLKPLLNLGRLLARERRHEEALARFDQALRLAPDSADAHRGRAGALAELGRGETAIVALRRAVELEPGDLDTVMRLGDLHQVSFRFAEAEAAFARALELDADHAPALAGVLACRAQLCRWEGREAGIGRLRELLAWWLAAGRGSPVSPTVATLLGLGAAEQLAVARDAACRLLAEAAPLRPALPPRPAADGSGRLRLGYLSSDFRDNALAHLTRRLYGLHDRERFAVYAYSLGADDGSDYRRGIAAECDRFVDLQAATPLQAASRIRADGVDVLVDLTGFAAGARPAILARRPAPVQVGYLFPNTSGGLLDYLLGDAVVTPLSHRAVFAEQLVLLPFCYQINDHLQPVAPRAFTRSAQGLPDDAFVFAAFNNHWKIEPTIWGVWMRLLGRVPRSVLWLQDMAPAARETLRREAEARGVRGDRLVFAPHLPKAEHLARLALGDLFLDTWICNAHTTASDSLYGGVPVLTCPGQHLPQRVAASLLGNARLPELVVDDLAAYEETAAALAHDRSRLAALRARLATPGILPLYDTPRQVRDLERAYRAMWERHLAGASPAPIVLPPETALDPAPERTA